ncbi:DUF4190 domain-containing protein [Stieleria varia]|uniref:DUF3299 domain-containing protein n=1 Tax=Stieleria varia TaxID=2528005 RepID=A0A5C6ASM4_9BACT|nr:DUF4190 domain-containing protein [Stieleria varia]TWU01194.1 hypothetical protein Pla52n_45660 [Stieleria varia]
MTAELSADLSMSSSHADVDFPYRAISRSAIFSTVLFVVGLFGLIPPFEFVLSLAALGVVVAIVAIRSIRSYPNEFSGMALAKFGLVANLALLIGGIGLHTYIYMTEVPPGYQRVQFYNLQQVPGLPDQPTQLAFDIDGEKVFIKGYIHPSSGGGMLSQFILVPDLGTCCFGGQPKSSDMIEVTLTNGQRIKGGVTRQKLAGEFKLNKQPRKQTDFDNLVFYRLRADQAK